MVDRQYAYSLLCQNNIEHALHTYTQQHMHVICVSSVHSNVLRTILTDAGALSVCFGFQIEAK